MAAKEGISEKSQSNYFCSAYRHLINGTEFNRKLSAYIWECYLLQIFAEFSVDIKRNALKSFLRAIEYYEAKSKSNAPTLREIDSKVSPDRSDFALPHQKGIVEAVISLKI